VHTVQRLKPPLAGGEAADGGRTVGAASCRVTPNRHCERSEAISNTDRSCFASLTRPTRVSSLPNRAELHAALRMAPRHDAAPTATTIGGSRGTMPRPRRWQSGGRAARCHAYGNDNRRSRGTMPRLRQRQSGGARHDAAPTAMTIGGPRGTMPRLRRRQSAVARHDAAPTATTIGGHAARCRAHGDDNRGAARHDATPTAMTIGGHAARRHGAP